MTDQTENPNASAQDDIKTVLQDTLFQQVQTLLNFTHTDGFALQIPETDTLILTGPLTRIAEFIQREIATPAASFASQSQAAQPTEWQPIESAPKDGRTLLLGCFNTHGRWRTMRGQWFSEAAIAEDWEDPGDAKEGWYETAVEPDVPNCWSIDPTHWMPLPVAPGSHIAGTSQATKAQAEPVMDFDSEVRALKQQMKDAVIARGNLIEMLRILPLQGRFLEATAAATVLAEIDSRPTDDHLWDETIRDRDTYHQWADKLAEAIGVHFGVDIGEHSNANLPWAEALEAIEAAVDSPYPRLAAVREWIATAPHGENCYLTDEPEFDRCRCGKDEVLAIIDGNASVAKEATLHNVRPGVPTASQVQAEEAELYRTLTGDAMALGFDGITTALGALRATREAETGVQAAAVHPIIQRQIERLREKWTQAHAQVGEHGEHLIIIPSVTLPAGWSPTVCTLLFVAPIGYPGAVPENFWIDVPHLELNGQPHHWSNASSLIPGFPGWEGLTRFKWHLQAWNPNRDSLWSVAHAILCGMGGSAESSDRATTTSTVSAPAEIVAWMQDDGKQCTTAESKRQMETCGFGSWAEIAARYTIPLGHIAAPSSTEGAQKAPEEVRNVILEEAASACEAWGNEKVAKWADFPDMHEDAKARAWDAIQCAAAIRALKGKSC